MERSLIKFDLPYLGSLWEFKIQISSWVLHLIKLNSSPIHHLCYSNVSIKNGNNQMSKLGLFS